MRVVAWVFAGITLVGVVARLVPAAASDLPYLPVIVALTPWFAATAVVALVLSHALGAGARIAVRVLMLGALALEVLWQGLFLVPHAQAGASAGQASAPAQASATTLRVMTCNVYKGKADPKRIVELVRSGGVQVLALQETTRDFVSELERAGLGELLPYSSRASSDGVYGNGIWSALPISDAQSDAVGSSASAMPSGTVTLGAGDSGADARVCLVSVHTCAPVPGYWDLWKRSVEEIGSVRNRAAADTATRYVLMGDFNATYDHAPFREMLGGTLRDAAREVGRLTLTWPADRGLVPALSSIDHVVMGPGVGAQDIVVAPVVGTDHKALLATLEVS